MRLEPVLFLVAVVLLGINFVAVRISNEGLDPTWGAALRFAVAALLLFALVAARRIPLPRGGALVGAAVFGVLAFGATYALMYGALQYASAGTAAVVFALLPLLTLLLAAAIAQEHLTAQRLLGAVVSFAGIAWIFRDGLAASVPGAALAAIVVSVLAAAVAGITVRQLPKAHPYATNAVAMAIGAALLAVVSRVQGESWTLPPDARTTAAVVYLVLSSAVAFVVIVTLLGVWRASAVAQQAVLSPLVTVPVAALLVHEVPSLGFVAGGAVALLGVWLGIRDPGPARAAGPAGGAPGARAPAAAGGKHAAVPAAPPGDTPSGPGDDAKTAPAAPPQGTPPP